MHISLTIKEVEMRKFFGSNRTRDRLLRTILQGIIGVLVANIDVFIGFLAIPAELRPVIAAMTMAILSPIMSELGKEIERAEYTDNAEDPVCNADEDLREEEAYGND